MIRVMRIASVVLLLPTAAEAQNATNPTCVDVAKNIDKYADQEVSPPTFRGPYLYAPTFQPVG